MNAIAPHRLIPVIAIERTSDADSLADALLAGGLPVAEVTFRTPVAAAAMRMLAQREGMIVGAGTVLTIDQAKQAMDAGASFLVSPGCNPRVIEFCVARQFPIVPGVATPTDIELALSLGVNTVKFFPAEALGGVAMLKALAAPYRMVKFVPTGGVHPGNLRGYLAVPSVVACGGSWMVDSRLVTAGNFDRIRELTREAVTIAS